jgi:hypothetical protein
MEYLMTVLVVIAALIAMRIYMKRSLAGYLRSASDSMGSQYDPKDTKADVTTVQSSLTQTVSNLQKDYDLGKDVDGDGITDKADVMITTTTTLAPDVTTTNGYVVVGPAPPDLWN